MSNDQEYVPNLQAPAPVENPDANDISRDWSDIKKLEREKFIQDHKTELKDDDITVFSRPRSGCKHCHGLGVEGFYAASSKKDPLQVTLCRCVTNNLVYNKITADTNKYLTYGEFRALLNNAKVRFNLKETKDEQASDVGVDSLQGTHQEVGALGNERQPGEIN